MKQEKMSTQLPPKKTTRIIHALIGGAFACKDITGHWSLHPSCQLVVDEALRADISQPESQSLGSAQGHFSKASLEKAAA